MTNLLHVVSDGIALDEVKALPQVEAAEEAFMISINGSIGSLCAYV